MMRILGSILAWELLNISLEYTATAWWVQLPRWILATVTVNLATHPVLSILVMRFGTPLSLIVPCEIAIFIGEWFLLMALYGATRWRRLLLASFAMNATSYFTGLLL